MKNIVVFTGAGISAESGLGTFRNSGGLWEKFKISDVATPEAFQKNPHLVLSFYNSRRRQLLDARPNNAHIALNRLQEKYNLNIITQNIDNLHERSGTKNVMHLHGKLNESKSTVDGTVYNICGSELNVGDFCKKGGQLRPNVVWFGEDVPNMAPAIKIVKRASIFIIIGTSLNVYPAASLVNYASGAKRVILIDQDPSFHEGVEIIKGNAVAVVPRLVSSLLKVA